MLSPHLNSSTTPQRTQTKVYCTPKSIPAHRKCCVWNICDTGQKSGETMGQTTAKWHKICNRNERCRSLKEKAHVTYQQSGFSLVCSDFSIAPQHAKCVRRGVPELWKTGEKAEDGGPETLKEVTLLAASRARLSDTQWSTGTGLVLCDAQHWSKAYRSTFLESPFCGSWKERGVSRRSGLKCPLTSLLGQGCSWL